jgi:16S rRNA (uracil1498-N3)-methyltransferase
LKLEPGDPIRVGIANVGAMDSARIEHLGDRASINLGDVGSVRKGIPPAVDLILAIPRPQKLERLLPIVSCMGVRNLYLVNAKKVENDYLGKYL